jgi:putative ABC transport system permease protein
VLYARFMDTLLDTLIQDIRYAFRSLLKSPGFAIVAVLTLTLGIGANTAIFSVVNAALLRALPFRDPERLVQLWHVPPAKSFPGLTEFAVSPANYVDWRSQSRAFEQMAIYAYSEWSLTGKDRAEALTGASVSQEFFPVLGSQPMLGRTFAPEEDQSGRGNVVVLGNALWQSRFGSDRNIVGKQIALNGQSYTVIGVMPRDMRFPSWGQLWTPMAWTDKQRAVRGEHHYLVIARLKPGVLVSQAQVEMNTISSRLEQQYPDDDKGWGAVVVPLRDQIVGDLRPMLLVLLGAVGFVLLIACGNIANLFVAKALSRRKEIAIRTALGASRSRLVRQILSESTLLSITGGILGLLLSLFATRLLVAFLADRLSASIQVKMDGRVLAFTFLISVLTGVLAGLAPAWRLIKTDVNEAMKEGMGRTDSDAGGDQTRSVLVVSEVALSLVLLIGAGLMIRSLWRLHRVDPGFDAHGVLTLTARVSDKRFSEPQQQVAFCDQVLQRVKTLPGVDSAGTIDSLPLGGGSTQPIAIEGRPKLPTSEQPEVAVRRITPGYLGVMRIPLMHGRDLNEQDTSHSQYTVLISESMARRFWPNENPVGKHLTLSFFPDKPREIVGIVGDVKQRGLDVLEPVETLYFPLSQDSSDITADWRSFPMTVLVRTTSNPSALVSAVTRVVHELDPDIPVVDVMTMEDYVSTSLSQQQMSMLLLGSFAGLALLLASIGIYSVLAYAVRHRLQEIAIRMALGARGGDVLKMILGQGAKLAAMGVAIGMIAAVALTRVMATQLFQISATDPLTFVAVAFLLMLVAVFACYLPARRAAKVDPMVALRYE